MSTFGSSITDITILLAIVAVVLVLLVSMEHRRRLSGGASRKKGKGSPGRSRGTGGRSELPSGDAELLRRLGWVLRGPAEVQRAMKDQKFFLKAARRALQEGILTEGELLRLARAARFPITRISSEELSTLKLASGVEVSVADSSMTSGSGVLSSVDAQGLHLRLRRGQTHFPMGTRLDVVCNSPQGLVRFMTVVSGTRGKALMLDHTQDVEQVQRRRHRRRDVQFAGSISSRGSVGGRTKTLDLSIGGCACRNPDRALSVGDGITLSLQAGSGARQQRITVAAQIVRISRGGKVLHLQFADIPENTRRVLFHAIVAASR